MITASNDSHLAYYQQGHGPRPLLLFHGFGQTHEVFLPLAKAIQDTHTCYLFDLYFHGNSQWPDDEHPLEKETWKHIVSDFLTQHNIHKFSVGGFSLGGKLALAIVEAFPERIVDVYLIAPDGIKTSFWYSLATYPYPLRKLFKFMIKQPRLFFVLANFFNRLGLVDRGLMRFAFSQMSTVFRHLHFDMKKIARHMNVNGLNTFIVVGQFDKVIRRKNMDRLLDHLEKKQLVVLPAGHNGLLKSEELARVVLGGDVLGC
jgi:pimeloyl-ACP methyl ester carboxylesterase